MNEIDENGITWFRPEDKKEVISQSRDEPNDDDRWTCLKCGAHNQSNVCEEGFKCKNCDLDWTPKKMMDECDKVITEYSLGGRALNKRKELEDLIKKEKANKNE